MRAEGKMKEQWYRIDVSTGSIRPVDNARVRAAAAGAFSRPWHAIATGRFRTRRAIYTSVRHMTAYELCTELEPGSGSTD